MLTTRASPPAVTDAIGCWTPIAHVTYLRQAVPLALTEHNTWPDSSVKIVKMTGPGTYEDIRVFPATNPAWHRSAFPQGVPA